MINLLPYENKKQIRAARMNLILIKCLLFLTFAIIFLIISCTGAYFFLKNIDDLKKDQDDTSININDSKYSTIINQASVAQSDLLLTNNILNQQVKYSKIITSLANSLPSGVLLDGLLVNNSSINSTVVINLLASSSDKGQETVNNLNNSNIFYNASIVSNIPNQANPLGYPFLITINITINKANLI